MFDPWIGTLSAEDVYPGLATPDAPAPDRVTTDERTSTQGIGTSGFMANVSRSSMWFIAFAVLLVLLWYLSAGGE